MLRKVEEKDIQAAAKVLANAKKEMARKNIPQWMGEYPDELDIVEDIKNWAAYLYEDKGQIVGYAALELNGEPNYNKLYDGTWMETDNDYAVIHRSAIDTAQTGRGLGAKFFEELEIQARKSGKNEIRIDTHEKNLPMRALIAKRKYSPRGTVFVEDGTPRIVYQKFI